MTEDGAVIWLVLSVAAAVALLAYWQGPNFVWGFATVGALIGLLLAVFRSGFDWAFVGKAFVIGTLVGLAFEWLGRIGTKLAR